jgi:hypothetical protein
MVTIRLTMHSSLHTCLSLRLELTTACMLVESEFHSVHVVGVCVYIE